MTVMVFSAILHQYLEEKICNPLVPQSTQNCWMLLGIPLLSDVSCGHVIFLKSKVVTGLLKKVSPCGTERDPGLPHQIPALDPGKTNHVDTR